MVSLEVISANKNLRYIKTLPSKYSQETHICTHKETSRRMFHETLFGTTAAKNENNFHVYQEEKG